MSVVQQLRYLQSWLKLERAEPNPIDRLVHDQGPTITQIDRGQQTDSITPTLSARELAEVEAQVVARTKDLQNTRVLLAKASQRVADLDSRNDKQEMEITRLTEETRHQKEEVVQLRNACNQSEEQIKELTKDRDHQKSYREKWLKQYFELEEKTSQMAQDFASEQNKAKAKLTEDRATIARISMELASTECHRKNLIEQIALQKQQFRSDLDKLGQRLFSISSATDKLQKNHEKLKQTMKDHHNRSKAAQIEESSLADDNENLNAQLSTGKEEYQTELVGCQSTIRELERQLSAQDIEVKEPA